MGLISTTQQQHQHRTAPPNIPFKRMKTSLLAALFLVACLISASALAQRGQEDEVTSEVDPELAELNAFFKNLIPGSDTTLDADQLSQINAALGRSGPPVMARRSSRSTSTSSFSSS